MKLIKKYSNGEIELECENVLEALYEEGEFIEFDGRDRIILEKKDKRYLVR